MLRRSHIPVTIVLMLCAFPQGMVCNPNKPNNIQPRSHHEMPHDDYSAEKQSYLQVPPRHSDSNSETGTSYTGNIAEYLSSIANALSAMEIPSINFLTNIIYGKSAPIRAAESKAQPTMSLIKTYPQIIGHDKEVYDYFANQAHLCGIDLNLTYPQTRGHFPSVKLTIGTQPAPTSSLSNDDSDKPVRGKRVFRDAEAFFEEVGTRFWRDLAPTSAKVGERDTKEGWKADKRRRNNDTVDSHYGCYIWDELVDFAVNYTYPWGKFGNFDTFDVPAAPNTAPVKTPVDLSQDLVHSVSTEIAEGLMAWPTSTATGFESHDDRVMTAGADATTTAPGASVTGSDNVSDDEDEEAAVAEMEIPSPVEAATTGAMPASSGDRSFPSTLHILIASLVVVVAHSLWNSLP